MKNLVWEIWYQTREVVCGIRSTWVGAGAAFNQCGNSEVWGSPRG